MNSEPAMKINVLNISGPRPGSRHFALLASLAVAACGGGGGGGGPTAPEPTVTSMNVNPVGNNPQALMVTLTGTNLTTTGLSVSSPQCTSLTRSSAAVTASDASTAYYQCATTAAASSTVTVTAARSSDNVSLGTASFTIGAPTTVNEALAGDNALPDRGPGLPAVAGTAKYSQTLTVTVKGSNVNQGLDVSSSSCSGMALSVSPPFISTASTAYYRCKANSANGRAQVSVALLSDLANPLFSPQFIVDTPQVTLTVKSGTGTAAKVLGDVVMTLTPNERPVTVDNFLNYVNSGFYNGTIFDLISKTPTPTLMVGGTYVPTSGSPFPILKAANAPIALEAGQGLSNVQWTVAMVHPAVGPDSATSGFYFNLVDNLHLDSDFAVFGTVATGASRDVLNLMAAAACVATPQIASDCLPSPNLIIDSAVQSR
jgi:cyclophilin family peptidyl-prolyl cis-trans isomerase